MEVKECRECGKPIPEQRLNRWPSVLSCSVSCTGIYLKQNHRALSPHAGRGLSTGAVGAISELVVCANLLQKGFDVFRNVSPTGKADLLATKKGNVFKIQVRTGSISPASGLLLYPKRGISECDVVAVAVSENVLYFDTTDMKVLSSILDA